MDPMEATLLIPKENQPGLGRKSEYATSSLSSCRPHLLLIPAVIFFLYAYNQVTAPNTIHTSQLFRRSGHHGHTKDCESKRFKKETMKVLMEFSFGSLFLHSGVSKFEASDVIIAKDSTEAIVVFDNIYSIAILGHPHMHDASHQHGTLPPKEPPVSSLAKWSKETKGASQFEFIAFNESAGVYIVGQESVNQDDGADRAVTYDVTFSDGSANVGTRCVAAFEFSHSNKGFEGAIVVTTKQGESLLVGICEGNKCVGGRKGRDVGKGRLVVMRRVMRKGKCLYEVVETVKLPKEINFEDYSAISVWNETTVAIASQENAALFIGELDLDGGVKVSGGRIVDFPRNDDCEIKYCNVEGIAFVNEKTILAVSDSMKSGGKQHFRCREKDESLGIFMLP